MFELIQVFRPKAYSGKSAKFVLNDRSKILLPRVGTEPRTFVVFRDNNDWAYSHISL